MWHSTAQRLLSGMFPRRQVSTNLQWEAPECSRQRPQDPRLYAWLKHLLCSFALVQSGAARAAHHPVEQKSSLSLVVTLSKFSRVSRERSCKLFHSRLFVSQVDISCKLEAASCCLVDIGQSDVASSFQQLDIAYLKLT